MSWRASDQFVLPADYYDPPEWDEDEEVPYEIDPDLQRDLQLEREWVADALNDEDRPESDMPVAVMRQGYDAMRAWRESQ